MGPKLRHALQKEGGHTFSDSDWLEYLYNGSGHTGGELIAPELMNHVAIPLKWKEFLHRGCSFDVTSILQAGRVAGILHTIGRSRRRIQQLFYRGREECIVTSRGSLLRRPSTGSTSPGHRKKDRNFGRQGLAPSSFTIQCRPTASKKVVCLQEDRIFYQRISTPRPAPKTVLKDAGQLKQQQKQQQHGTLSSSGGGKPM